MTYKIIYDHDVDMGPVRPEGYPRYKHRRGEVDAEDLDRTLHVVQRKFESLNLQVPMFVVEDLLVAIWRWVVRVPRDWVQLFHRVATAIVFYRNMNVGHGPHD